MSLQLLFNIVEFILECVGPETCIDILTEALLPDNSISSGFYSYCNSKHQDVLQSR